MPEERLVVIDTDAGLDDALALFISLRAHKQADIAWRILGITCVHGNTALDNVCVNVTRVVEVAKLSDEIPIFRGADRPLVYRTEKRSSFYHGTDGFGDADFSKIEPRIEHEHAVHALVRLAHEYEGKLTIIAIGPLTNIALAINMDPTFSQSIKELCVMGGNVWGVGNIRACAEFNFWADPESVHVVLESPWRQPILLIPWETCKIEAKMPLEWRTDVLGKVTSSEADMMNAIEEKILSRNTKIHDGWVSCDALVPAVMLSSKITMEVQSHFCRIELNGFHTRGQLVLDRPRLSGEEDNVLAVTKIDLQEYEKMLVWGLYGIDEIDFSMSNHIVFPA
ncbi:inosine-uridine preferring nucleoside hydrolase [Folsomia candida]|uniref:inosine-uridine preferring nucleoside hydrolase n=1 Tax=Folsomia candida TaxID=158441 RepID=UPI000B8F4373|nr:inosine-uridine preferring nucleoside hydrolase [Folsomia candida]